MLVVTHGLLSTPTSFRCLVSESGTLTGIDDPTNSKDSHSTCERLACVKCFTRINAFNTYDNPMREMLLIPSLYR